MSDDREAMIFEAICDTFGGIDEAAALPRAKDQRPRVNVRVSSKLYERIENHCKLNDVGMRHFAVMAFEQALKRKIEVVSK